MNKAYKKEEDKMRKLAKKHGYRISKSRADISSVNYGGYRIINAHNNLIEAGEIFNLLLEDVEAFFNLKVENKTSGGIADSESNTGNQVFKEIMYSGDKDPWS